MAGAATLRATLAAAFFTPTVRETTLLAGAVLAGIFFAGAFFAGVFFAGAFAAAVFFAATPAFFGAAAGVLRAPSPARPP